MYSEVSINSENELEVVKDYDDELIETLKGEEVPNKTDMRIDFNQELINLNNRT